MDRVDRWTAPLFCLFFVISGAELKLSIFTSGIIVLIGIIYIISRSIGKYSGAFLSSKLAKSDDNIVKYLGITLLPQAGVALGMANLVQQNVLDLGAKGATIAEIVVNITLFAVLIYELVGPLLTKIALQKAGEINPEGKTSAREEHAKTKQENQA
jgi:Kef-type K+ transport system membrane component KefB